MNVRILGVKGHETVEMTVLELLERIDLEAKEGKKFYVVDEETKKVIDALAVKEGQKIALIRIIGGG